MSRSRKKYGCGQPRGGGRTERKASEKNYHRQELMFHGSESAFQKWSEKKGGY